MSQKFSILGTSTVNQRGKRLHCLAVMQWEGHFQESKVRYAIKHIT